MCGILGAADFEKSLEQLYPALEKGLKAISHRGPESSRDERLGNVYLGHNRLSIIDLSEAANEPMRSVNSDAYIIYNGEIYNYKELKENLKVKFGNNSDAEVVLEGYLKEGIDFFKKLRGIYAFAIFDNRIQKKIILGRDPSGIKPMYIFSKGSFYIFASEMKAILPSIKSELTINEEVLKCYLNLGYCPEPFTIYSQINTLKPGHFLEIDAKGIKSNNLIEYNFECENKFSYEENTRMTEEKLKTAVGRNLIADVEVAVALSGGIDSSLIYAFANQSNKNIKGLTVKFKDKEHNESEIAEIYSSTMKGKHELVEVESELNLETLNKILLDFDQPYADSSAINVYYLTKAVRKITKVLIGGDGGDEIYNGYPSMTWLTYIQELGGKKIVQRGGQALMGAAKLFAGSSQKRLIKRISDLWSDKPHELLYDWHSWFPRKTNFQNQSPFLFDTSAGINLYKTIFKEDAPSGFKQYVVFDYFRKTMLSDYLRKTDMMSMLNSVEYRVPMLDEDLTAFALTIPFKQKSSLKQTKKILRQIHKSIYPTRTANAPKRGFTIPLDTSLAKDDFEIIKNELMCGRNIVNEYIKGDYIKFLFQSLDNRDEASIEISRAGIYQRILMLYSLHLWEKTR